MPNIIQNKNVVKLEELATAPNAIVKNVDTFGNTCYWLELDAPGLILDVARIMVEGKARLLTTTAYIKDIFSDALPCVCYHFDIEGIVYNITVSLESENACLPSITSFFRNADWNEREMMELHAINIIDHPNPIRLFLDDQIEKGILTEAVPLSIMMNGACTVDLWERILRERVKSDAQGS